MENRLKINLETRDRSIRLLRQRGAKRGKRRRLLVEFEKPSFDNFMNLIFYLEDLLGREVNILTAEGLERIRTKDEIKRTVIYV